MPHTRSQLYRIAVLLAAMVVVRADAQTAGNTQGGYADRTSVAAGETLSFHIATSSSPFDVTIVNLAHPSDVLATIGGLMSAPADCTGLWENGCGWAVTTQFTVPSNWPSGYYAARFPTSGGTRYILFVVKAADPGSSSPIVVISPTNTYAAYNQFGGKSVYDSLSTDNQRAHVVSFNRPYADAAGLSRFPSWEQKFVDWMTSEGRAFEVATDDDLLDPAFLGHYKLVMVVGHSEYWDLDARRNLESFRNSGGHIAILGGNTMWWQARVDAATRQLTVYKDASLDPLTGTSDAEVTVNWFNAPVYNPENLITGVSFRNAGYANVEDDFEPLPDEQRTPYTVRDAGDWVFAGTGLMNGATFGAASAGIEVDGAIFNTDAAGALIVDGSDGSPLNYRVLATVPASDGYGTVGYYVHPSGAVVFNAGSRDWARGLVADAAVQTITRNVIERLSTGARMTYEPRTTPFVTQDLFNTPSPMAGVLEGWTRDLLQAELSARCAQEGPFGLELKGTDWTQLARNVAPRNDALDRVSALFYLNADLLQASPSFSMPVLDFVNDTPGSSVKFHASVEVRIFPAGKSIRFSAFTNGTRTAATPWTVIPSGWQPVRVSWASPGTIELKMRGMPAQQAFNSTSGQLVNEVMIEFAGSAQGAVGSICMDQLEVRNMPAAASAQTSTIVASPSELPADGTSTATVTLTLRDASGRAMAFGGDAVSLSASSGTIGAVTDNDDGTYTATLMAPSTAGTAIIEATVNGVPLDATATVTFTAIELSAPHNLNAVPTTQSSVRVSWATVQYAASYVVERATGSGAFAPIATISSSTFNDTTVSANTIYLYRVHAVDANGNPGPDSEREIATTILFSRNADGIIRASDFDGLRQAIDWFRRVFGLANATYSRAIVPGSVVLATDLTQMRTAVNEARAAAGLDPYPFSAPVSRWTTVITARQPGELQEALGADAWD